MKPRILLIEDQDLQAKIFIERLNNADYEVVHANDHAQAEKLLATDKHFTAILSDGETGAYKDPSGKSDVQVFIEQNAAENIPIYVMSTNAGVVDAVRKMNHASVKAVWNKKDNPIGKFMELVPPEPNSSISR